MCRVARSVLCDDCVDLLLIVMIDFALLCIVVFCCLCLRSFVMPCSVLLCSALYWFVSLCFIGVDVLR